MTVHTPIPPDPAHAARSAEEVLSRLLPTLEPVAETQPMPLEQARGCILAADLVADEPVPAFARSAVDGYALGRVPAAGDVFALRGRLPAGRPAEGLYCGDGAVRIFTGAMVPADTACIAMQEDCAAEDGFVRVGRGLQAGANIRPAGEDVSAGSVALAAGTRLDARHIAVAASLNRPELLVRRRVRVATLTTGDELLDVGPALPLGRIVDTNRYLLAGLIDAAGFERVDLGRVADDPAALADAFARARDCDAVITTGGVSVGEEDHVRAVVEHRGGRIDQWRIAIKPGKPLAVGRLAEGPLFLGLPGNPNAVFVTFALIALPALRALGGAAVRALPVLSVVAGESFERTTGRREYVPVRIGGGKAFRLGSGSSAQQAAVAAADALMIVPPDLTAVEAGHSFDAIPISALIG
jgi:molybdopterin molybdotransferase